jgi:hypothetical protein
MFLSGVTLVVLDCSIRCWNPALLVLAMWQVLMELDMRSLLPLPAGKVLCTEGKALYWLV